MRFKFELFLLMLSDGDNHCCFNHVFAGVNSTLSACAVAELQFVTEHKKNYEAQFITQAFFQKPF